jgi:hypothetical protein
VQALRQEVLPLRLLLIPHHQQEVSHR